MIYIKIIFVKKIIYFNLVVISRSCHRIQITMNIILHYLKDKFLIINYNK